MKNLVVVEVQDREPDGYDAWRVIYLKEDGTYHVHDFPKETLEWRAAEYNIEPEDVDTLLDIVLHEPFVDPQDTAVREAGKLSPAVINQKKVRRGDPEPTNLFNAPTIGEARVAHLLRVEDAKKNRVSIKLPKGANPLDKIRNQHQARPGAVSEKKRLVAEGRKLLREGTPITESPNPSIIREVK